MQCWDLSSIISGILGVYLSICWAVSFFFFFGLSFAMTTVVEGCVLYGELH